jgi:glycosyltransferase involved in cell wall biosynthesis
MSAGLPVIARKVGHVPDIVAVNDKCLHVYEGHNEDVEALKECIKKVMDKRTYRINLRVEAEKYIKDEKNLRSDKWRANEYRKLYEEVANATRS